MKIRTPLSLIVVCLLSSFRLFAQTGIAGNEQYNSYDLAIMIDQLPINTTSSIVDSSYYSHLKQWDYVAYQIIDTTHRKREVHLRSKKANDGYLFINECIRDSLTKHGYLDRQLKVIYVYNNKTVKTNKEVMKVVRLKKKRIQISELLIDEDLGVITIYFVTK